MKNRISLIVGMIWVLISCTPQEPPCPTVVEKKIVNSGGFGKFAIVLSNYVPGTSLIVTAEQYNNIRVGDSWCNN